MKSKVITLISAILIAMFVAIPPVKAQGETSYSFIFMGRTNAAYTIAGTHVEAGDGLRFVGSGTFDTSTGAVSGGGAWSHIKFDGKVHAVGYWTVKKFVSFTDGLLTIIVEATSYHVGAAALKYGKGPTVNTFTLKISSEGFTVWVGVPAIDPVFGVVVWGRALFHLNK